MDLDEAYRECERITWTQARNFAYGIRLLPAHKRRGLAVIYAFARRIDDIGDGTMPPEDKIVALEDARLALGDLAAASPEDPVLLALADVLLGHYDPSGHLPFTWYSNESELPSINNYGIRPGGSSPGRTYMYFRGAVSFPFGYGLSYSTFSASDLRVNRTHLTPNDTLDALVNVTNTGRYYGEDLVQLYVTKSGSGHPVKRLDPQIVPEVVLEPTDMPWGNRSMILRDPDGGLVNLFTPVTKEAKAKYGR